MSVRAADPVDTRAMKCGVSPTERHVARRRAKRKSALRSTDHFLQAEKKKATTTTRPQTHDANHNLPQTTISSIAVSGSETRARTRKRDTNPQEAFPGLPQDVVATYILRSGTDPIVLARLRAVSRAMRDAVDKTGLLVEEKTTEGAAELGWLDTLQHKLQKGGLNKSYVCLYAGKGGQLEVLQWARGNGCPWDKWTCAFAAHGGQLEVLQWARANSCPWDANTCAFAAKGGHLQVLQWLRANGCPWDEWTCEMAVEGEAEMYGLRASGHHDLFVWARENGCPMNDETRNSAGPLGWLGDDDW